MKKGRNKNIKPTDGNVGGNSLYQEVEGEPESVFYISTQNSEIGEKIIEQAKGDVKVDKSIDFFLSEFPLSEEDGD
jgi:hypothetical protein